MNKNVIYVFDSFSFDEPVLIGKLFIVNNNGKETFGFEYDEQWLVNHH